MAERGSAAGTAQMQLVDVAEHPLRLAGSEALSGMDGQHRVDENDWPAAQLHHLSQIALLRKLHRADACGRELAFHFTDELAFR